MASPQTHPRRRPHKATGSPTPLDTSCVSLRKSSTFHSPKSVASDICDPLDNCNYMPKRSQTCKESLEDMLNDAGARRVAKFLDDFDKTFSGITSSVPEAGILREEGVLPLPSFMLHHTSMDRDAMDIDSKSTHEDDQCDKDSGLGSSISGSKQEHRSIRSSTRRSVQSSATSTNSAVTRSFSALGAQTETTRALSSWAEEQIQKRIVKPILAEPALKDFHRLIKDVPRQIGDKRITNLRDLEKTLIFLAPDFAASPKSYLEFCETSIHCIHTTVDHLSESDQRLPTDRPYTNHYFLDLVEQIRRYAAIMAATREKQATGEELDEMDYSPTEKISLRGGLSHDGKPVELVREKDGKVIPIAEGSSGTMSPSKRPLAEEEMDSEEVRRSMARRRKSDKAGDVMHQCRDCGKEFKRPCDLTKHEKTHSRPWKCSDSNCKYHELGWPTEKERDRHMNDKHSANPPRYNCLYSGCPYHSKRESNCKQHMEKAHGYTYVRSKSNGRKKNNNILTPQTPMTPLINTPTSALQAISTPITPFEASPSVGSYPDFDFNTYPQYTPAISTDNLPNQWRRESDATADSAVTYSSSHSPDQPTSFEEAITPEEPEFNHDMDLNNLNMNINFGYNVPSFQQPTPALSAGDVDGLQNFSFEPPVNANFTANNTVPHLSPGAQPNMTLFSPPMASMQIDEGFSDDTFLPPQGQDFMLFEAGSNTASGSNTTAGADWFPELSNALHSEQFNTMYPTSMDEDLNDMIRFSGQP